MQTLTSSPSLSSPQVLIAQLFSLQKFELDPQLTSGSVGSGDFNAFGTGMDSTQSALIALLMRKLENMNSEPQMNDVLNGLINLPQQSDKQTKIILKKGNNEDKIFNTNFVQACKEIIMNTRTQINNLRHSPTFQPLSSTQIAPLLFAPLSLNTNFFFCPIFSHPINNQQSSYSNAQNQTSNINSSDESSIFLPLSSYSLPSFNDHLLTEVLLPCGSQPSIFWATRGVCLVLQ
ncbi:MAG: hypothetical protein EZS28_035465 [Streblomastix strix]|uniref:Uncharacterized protein n=1 Tax=Streblomastix strix TaxID=222440 RepID=A0A5J4UEE2_9EUKA|nr:MAG: hypothetical protein EZS28_035465 [Streblomastix strix]